MKNLLFILTSLVISHAVLAAPLKIKGEQNKSFESTAYVAVEPWTLEEHPDHHILRTPEGDLTMVFMVLPAKGKPGDIFKAAWKKIKPDFNYKVDQEVAPPATGGWEEVHKISYEVPIQDSRLLAADYGLLKGKAYITMIDGKYATLQKRGAQLQTMAQSWKPKELVEEKLGERTAVKLTAKEIRQLDQFLQNSMRELQVPGAQVAFVQDGKVVWEKAFGVHQKGRADKVSSDTLFMIGSTTKPLTTLLQARLVDQEKLDWDDSLRKILPNFALADSSATRKMELRHTACACTGMPRRDLDFIFDYEGITPEQRLESLKTMTPTTDFGETFQYSNLLVAAGGYAAAHALYPALTLEAAYEKALREEVFKPLGFMRSRVKPFSGDRLASPHSMDIAGRMTPIPQRIDDTVYAVAPAGAVWSNATDLSRYVMFELGNGVLDGQRILSEKNIKARREPGVKVDDTAKYGLGLFFDDVKGIQTWGHGGNTLGFTSDMVFIPSQNVGWVLLTNAGSSPLRNIFQQKVFEVLFKAEPQAQKTIAYTLKRRRENVEKARQEISTSASKTKWIKDLSGNWQSEDLGSASIKADAKGYTADFGEWQSQLGVLTNQKNTMVLTSPPWGGGIPLMLQEDGTLMLDAGQTKYTFKRVP